MGGNYTIKEVIEGESKIRNDFSDKIYFIITYSVKPSDTDDPMKSAWQAGNGYVEGEWIVNKTGIGAWEEGQEFSFGTGM